MKDCIFGLAVGMIIGAVAVTLYKPAQSAVKNGTNFVKNKTEELLNGNNSKDWL